MVRLSSGASEAQSGGARLTITGPPTNSASSPPSDELWTAPSHGRDAAYTHMCPHRRVPSPEGVKREIYGTRRAPSYGGRSSSPDVPFSSRLPVRMLPATNTRHEPARHGSGSEPPDTNRRNPHGLGAYCPHPLIMQKAVRKAKHVPSRACEPARGRACPQRWSPPCQGTSFRGAASATPTAWAQGLPRRPSRHPTPNRPCRRTSCPCASTTNASHAA